MEFFSTADCTFNLSHQKDLKLNIDLKLLASGGGSSFVYIKI